MKDLFVVQSGSVFELTTLYGPFKNELDAIDFQCTLCSENNSIGKIILENYAKESIEELLQNNELYTISLGNIHDNGIELVGLFSTELDALECADYILEADDCVAILINKPTKIKI